MNRIDRAFQIAAVIGLVLVVLPLALPHDTRAARVLQNFMHVPVFALVAIAALRAVQSHRSAAGRPAGMHYLMALSVAAALGAASEIAQIPGPREASLQDWIVDVASAATALALARRLQFRTTATARERMGLATFIAAGALFLLAPVLHAAIAYGYRYQQLPDLFRLHGPGLRFSDLYFLTPNSARLTIEPLPATWNRAPQETSLKAALDPAMWPGIALEEPYPDWRGYRTLTVDLTNPQGHALDFTLRIHDRHHNNQLDDRFNGVVTLAPNSRQSVRIPLADVQRAPVGRTMDMEHIAGLILFRTSPGRGEEVVYVTRMALEK